MDMSVEKTNNSLSQYFAKEYKNLVRYASQYLNERYSSYSAEDIVQDVALNLFTKLDIDSKVENLAGYVYRSIRNRIVDTKRSHKNKFIMNHFAEEKGTDGEDLFIKLFCEIDEVDYALIDKELFYQKLNDAFTLLPPKQRAIITATEIEGLTYNEISDQWGIPVGTLLSWKHRGIKKLKQQIKLNDFYTNSDDNN